MVVLSAVSACEYTNCIILDSLGEEIEATQEVYEMDVEHLSAKDNIVQIWTYDKWDRYMAGECERIGGC